MSLEVAPVIKSSLSKQVADQLQEAILDGTLKADDRLPTEDEMAKRFQVSRPTIREALKRLAAKNLIRSRRGPTGGTFVNQLSASDLSDNLSSSATLFVSMNHISLDEVRKTRLELESLCCKHACENRTEENLEQLRQELTYQRNPDITPEEFCASDVRFHRIIAEASHNRMLSFVMYTLIEALQPVANLIAYRFREREIIISQHQRLFEALLEKSESRAIGVLEEQINYLELLHDAAQKNHFERHSQQD